VVVIGCVGELDLITCAALETAIGESFSLDVAVLCLDLTGITFFDSTSVRCLIECHRRCISRHVRLEVDTSPVVERVLALIGFRSATRVAGSPS
jgi:anti-anti-sigma factor